MLARIITADGEVLDVQLAVEETDEEFIEGENEPTPTEAENPILPAIDELIWATLSFAVLVVLFIKFAYPQVKATMEARTQRIRDSLDEAERTRTDAQRILDDYQRQLADAKNEASRIIEEARQTAEQMRRDLMARAEAEVQELRDRNRVEIEAAQNRALGDLETQVRAIAIELAERVIEANLDRDAQNRLIDSYINQVGSR